MAQTHPYFLLLLLNLLFSCALTGIVVFLTLYIKTRQSSYSVLFSFTSVLLLSIHFLFNLSFAVSYSQATLGFLRHSFFILLTSAILLFVLLLRYHSRKRFKFPILPAFFVLYGMVILSYLLFEIKLIPLISIPALMYGLFAFLYSYRNGVGILDMDDRFIEKVGFILLVFIPFLAVDMVKSSAFILLAIPLKSAGAVFFPFFFNAVLCLLAFATGSRLVHGKQRAPASEQEKAMDQARSLLSLREREIFEMLLRGSRNKDISYQLTISESTVKKHIGSIFSKLGVESRIELANLKYSLPPSHLVPKYHPNSTKGQFWNSFLPLKLSPRFSAKEFYMVRKKTFFVFIGTVLVLSLGIAGFLSLRVYRGQRPMNPVVDLKSYSWSFDNLIAGDVELDNADRFWVLSDPASEGLNEAALRTHLELCILTGADAVVVVKGNHIICEWYSPRYEAPWTAMSSTKSVTALVAGLMEDQGLLHVSDSVGSYLPEWQEADRNTVTIEHLLTMTAGFPRYDKEKSVGFVSDKSGYVRGLKPEKAPGAEWVYSNESYQILVPLLEAASGVALDRFAQECLFSLIGMEHSSYYSYNGEVWGYADMRTTPRDFLRLGLLVLNGGTWNENRILSQDYITRMLTPLTQFDNYGYGWWLYDESSPLVGYGTEGYLDTDMYVFPQEELLVMRMQAPKNSFTGKPESGSYQNLAWQLFPLICNEGDSDVILEVLRGFTDANISPVFAEALEKATQLSSQGEVQAVIALLNPFLEKNTGSQAQQNQAFLTMTLAYMRKQDLKTAKKYFDKVDPEYLYLLPDWYSSSYREYAELLK